MLILLKQQASRGLQWFCFRKQTSILLAKVDLKRFFKSHCQRILSVYQSFTKVCSKKDCELPKVQTQISTKHIYPFPRFELRARQNLHKCALLKAIMNHESHFHRGTHSSDLYSSLCRARSYIEIKSLIKLFICVLWKRQIDTRWKDKKCTREVFLKELLEKNIGTFDWMVRTQVLLKCKWNDSQTRC